MDHPVEDAPLARQSMGGSEELLVPPAAPRGASNKRALKIAGLATLVCLLVCSQVLTAFMAFSQRQQIHSLQTNAQKLRSMLNRPPPRAMGSMSLSMNTLPLLMDFDPKTAPEASKPPKPQDAVSAKKQFFEKFEEEPVRPSTQPSEAPVTRSKCQVELANHGGLIGSYKPQCDERGSFVPLQCWQGTGFCWCVEESGALVEGTVMKGKPACKVFD